jgi:hypothetical protein
MFKVFVTSLSKVVSKLAYSVDMDFNKIILNRSQDEKRELAIIKLHEAMDLLREIK